MKHAVELAARSARPFVERVGGAMAGTAVHRLSTAELEIGTTYDEARQKRYDEETRSIAAHLKPILTARRLFTDNNRSNTAIIGENTALEKFAVHPDPVNRGKVFIRTTRDDGKKALIEATPEQIKKASFIAVGGKDSSQTQKDCSAIAGLAEQHCGVKTPETLWPLLPQGSRPLVYLSRSTTPRLDRYASEGHESYTEDEPYTQKEAERFAATILLPRYRDSSGVLIEDPAKVPTLCGYSYSAGGKQWLAYVQALENRLVDNGLTEPEAHQLIAKTIRLAGIGLMPDIRGLRMYGMDTFYTVSIYDGGTRPQREEYKLFGNPLIQDTIEQEGVAFVTLSAPDTPVRHRLAMLGELPVTATTMFGHAPGGYLAVINANPLLAGIYRSYLTSAPQEHINDLHQQFDAKSMSFDSLSLPKETEVHDRTEEFAPWEYRIIANFAKQLEREAAAKIPAKAASPSR